MKNNPSQLKKAVGSLEERVGFIERLLKVEGEWITPSQAEDMWPYSRDRIVCEIRIAEERRAARQKTDLVYGVHYVSTLFPFDYKAEEGLTANPTKRKNTWKIHKTKFWEILSKPVDQRNL